MRSIRRGIGLDDVLWGTIALLGIAAILLAVGWIAPAKAEGVGNPTFLEIPDAPKTTMWKGFYLGVQGGYQVGVTELDLDMGGGGANLDGLSHRGFVGGIHGGFDYRPAGSPFLIGVFGEWNPLGSADFELSINGGGPSFNVISGSIEDEMKGGLRIGYITANDSLIYVGAFLSRSELNWSSDIGPSSGSIDMDGKGMVAGFAIPLNKNLSLGMQYAYTRNDTLKYDLGFADLNVDNDVHAVTGRLTFHMPVK